MDKKTKIAFGLAAFFAVDNIRIGLRNQKLWKQNQALAEGLDYLTNITRSALRKLSVQDLEDIAVDLEFFDITRQEK